MQSTLSRSMDTFGTDSMCPSEKDVRLIKSHQKGANYYGRDQLCLTVLIVRCPSYRGQKKKHYYHQEPMSSHGLLLLHTAPNYSFQQPSRYNRNLVLSSIVFYLRLIYFWPLADRDPPRLTLLRFRVVTKCTLSLSWQRIGHLYLSSHAARDVSGNIPGDGERKDWVDWTGR